MQRSPETPSRSKADEKIENLKQSLSTKWHINLPLRDSTWSPSHRDPKRLEDKICAFIQYLYFSRNAALNVAIQDFEKNAINVYSQWQYKPKADADVVPSRGLSRHQPKEGFLRKRKELPAATVEDLTASLHHHLSLIVDRVKQGETFLESERHENPAAPSVEEYPPMRPLKTPRQTSLTQWFRNKSAPGASIIHEETAQHFSSDEYPDSEMADLFEDGTFAETSKQPTAEPITFKATTASRKESPEDEEFKTPPTTPPRSNSSDISLGIGFRTVSGAYNQPKAIPFMPTVNHAPTTNRKRSCPDLEPMRPPPTRRVSREQKSKQTISAYTAPTPPPENDNSMSRSFSLTRSIDNISSVSSSFTSASPAWTSPNTSFCSDSMVTSFDSVTEETDTTVKPLQPRSKQLGNQSLSWTSLESPESYHAETHMKTPVTSEMTDSHLAQSNQKLPPATVKRGAMDLVTQSNRNVESQLLERLVSHPPFVPLPDKLNAISFRQLYEVIRISTSCGVPLSHFSNCLTQRYQDYTQFWAVTSRTVAKIKDIPLPEKSSLVAWNRAEEGFAGVGLAGRLKFLEQPNGPVFEFALQPMKLESSYRFGRKFGHDRFCVVLLPSLGPDGLPSYLKPVQVAARDIITKWLVETEHRFLGRSWRAFFVKPEPTKKAQKGVKSNSNDGRYRVHLFAEDGVDFRDKSILGEIDPRKSIHTRMTVKDLVEWFMSSKSNPDETILKFFARLGLGLTSTSPTLEFSQREVIWSDNAHSDRPQKRQLNFQRSEGLKTGRDHDESKAPVMNDGCARISRDAATAIANMLGMDQVPSVFQGRIGGAKGVWMVDASDERPAQLARHDGKVYWIENTDSQLKFKPHPIDALMPDAARLTFEVNKYSKKLSSSFLNFQLIPILESRGVPQEAFMRLLREDLSSRVGEMEVAMDGGLALRKWNQDTNPVSGERARFGGIEMVGGLPESTTEKINWFVEHGFEPKTCQFLKDQLWKSIHSYCLHLENRMHIGLGRSTNAFMIADPLAVLDEGEVHLGFSNVFQDTKSGFNETMLHDIEVLVARLPAHLPSDIQKVRAVFKPELRIYRDVVVFSSKGKVSLASKLSGGDYDGDTAWICWDPEIVDPFKNADVPEFPPPEDYGIIKDTTKVSDIINFDDYMNRFLLHAFQFNLQMSMLGICSNYHESLCYHKGTIDCPEMIDIGILLGNLVDSAKGGFRFDETTWIAFLKQRELPRTLEPPAYKDRKRERKVKDNLIDQLVFCVARAEREKALGNFTKHFRDVSAWDDDLVSIWRQEMHEAKRDKALQNVLKNLKTGFETIFASWKTRAKREDEDDDIPTTRKGTTPSFRSVVEKCRADYVVLPPTLDEMFSDDVSDTIRRWQRDHTLGKSSHWDLLKASVAFHHFHKFPSFIWHLAGIELGEIKATKDNRGTYRCIVNDVFETFKMDRKLVDGAKRRQMQLDELKKAEYDDVDDEYGSDVDVDMMDL